ncbi:cytochrome P450 2B5-like isoform X1 [Saccostrea cucullata]|uniref:cytochrome P450 2B5-like isoform X1 n=2 Tax=Saccostrea cuccullata TaxID=36930 RepID=UPI002ED4BE3B
MITAILCVFSFLFLTWWFFAGGRINLPPSPPCFPLIGNVGQFAPEDSIVAFRKFRKKYGDIFSLKIFHKTVIIVNGHDHIYNLFMKHGDVFSDRPAGILKDFFSKGKGVLGSSGSSWKEQRTFSLNALRKFGFGKRCLENQIMDEVRGLLEVIEKFEGQAIDIEEPLAISIANIICSIVFGKRFDYNDLKFKHLLFLLNQIFHLTTGSSFLTLFPALRHVPFDIFKGQTVQRNLDEIQSFIKEIIDNHRLCFDKNNINDFIDAFLMEQQNQEMERNTAFTDEQLVVTVQDLFAAGSETTVTTLRWAFLFLIHHPDIQTKLLKHIDEIIGEAVPQIEHREKLPYVEAFVLEVLRMGNIVPLGVPHCPNRDFEYGGYSFPNGVTVLANLGSALQDPNIFNNPQKFQPERFLDEDGKCKGTQKDKMIPFSTGRRVCLGENLARMELFLYLVAILQKFEIQPEDTGDLPSLKGHLGITYMPKPYKVKFIRRS